jgi:hypothetical protein
MSGGAADDRALDAALGIGGAGADEREGGDDGGGMDDTHGFTPDPGARLNAVAACDVPFEGAAGGAFEAAGGAVTDPPPIGRAL